MTREEQEEDAYFAGFAYGAEHAADEFHGAPGARDLGLYPGDFDLRDQWNHGRQDGACAVRLGHDAKKMLKHRMQGPSLLDPACLIVQLLDERDAARKELASLRALALALMEAEEAFYGPHWPPKGKGMFEAKQKLFAAVTKETP